MKRIISELKSIVILLLVLNFTAVISVTGQGGKDEINFRAITFDQALAASKKENKPIYMHGYADWCHYCKYMVDSVYTNKEVADFYNSNFISIKVNLEKEGKEINKILKAHTYPTIVFYDVNGEVMHRAAGRKYTQPFLELGKEALDTNRQMRAFKTKYESRTATPYEVQFYFRMQEIAGMSSQSQINEYLTRLSDSEFVTPNSWRIMYDIIKDPTLPVMNRFIDNKEVLSSKYTADSVNNKLITVHNSYLMQYVQQLDSVGYEKAKQKIRNNPKLDLAEKICAWAELNKYKMKSEWDIYRVEGKKFIEKYATNDARRLVDVAQVYYDRFPGDKDMMAVCEDWVKRSLKMADTYKGNNLLASISFVLGKKDQALQAANHAIDLAKIEKKDYTQTTMLIAAIERMK